MAKIDNPQGAPAEIVFSQMLECYRGSEECSAQVVDVGDADKIESGSPPEQPALWSTKCMDKDGVSGPWVTSNGRWTVSERGKDDWVLERLIGGTWREIGGSWATASPPMARRVIEGFRTNWEALRIAGADR